MTHCSQTEIPQTSYLTATDSCVLPPPVRRGADGKNFSYSWSALLVAAPQTQSCPFSVSAVFCHSRQHHQAFVSAEEVPPPDGSIMRLPAWERRAINKDDRHVWCLFLNRNWEFLVPAFFFSPCFSWTPADETKRTQSAIVYWICLYACITKTHSGVCLTLWHTSVALFILEWQRLTLNMMP